MDCVSGRLYRPTNKHAFAIVTQDSWSEQATILDNILFGAPYDEKRFDEVVEACALGPDLAAWEGREHTEVGERGISLSGGQRARVALARAVYSSASVLLLDDPCVQNCTSLIATPANVVTAVSPPLMRTPRVISSRNASAGPYSRTEQSFSSRTTSNSVRQLPV